MPRSTIRCRCGTTCADVLSGSGRRSPQAHRAPWHGRIGGFSGSWMSRIADPFRPRLPRNRQPIGFESHSRQAARASSWTWNCPGYFSPPASPHPPFESKPDRRGRDSVGYQLIAEVVETLLPVIIAQKIATAAEVGISLLAERIRDEVVASDSVVLSPGLIGAWSRKNMEPPISPLKKGSH
jgi:hypothetical protein